MQRDLQDEATEKTKADQISLRCLFVPHPEIIALDFVPCKASEECSSRSCLAEAFSGEIVGSLCSG